MNLELQKEIKTAIQNFNKDSLFDSSIGFFKLLNYPLDSIQEKSNYSLEEFLEVTGNKRSLYLKNNDIEKIEVLFSLSDYEMRDIKEFSAGQVENTIIETYLFLAIKLNNRYYSKTEIVNISKGINKLLNAPAFILFDRDEKITLSITDRRIHKKDNEKDVIEKTTLIKDIDIEEPHTAHIRILEDLEFKNLGSKRNFQEFHSAWKKVLDTKELNKKFYKELSNWYAWALQKVEFPDDKEKDKDKRNSQNVIRFITRIMFVWFLKEKGLVKKEIFNEEYIYKNILEKNADKTGSTYYKAILQNLFFASLNTEMKKDNVDSRRFIKNQNSKSKEYGIYNYYRYKRYLKNQDEEKLIALFEDIPFLNGGLFECLDETTNLKREEKRVDMFSDNPRNEERLIFPDELLFGNEKDFDLEDFYGSKKMKKSKVKGLINILENYKFTIEENTPLEEDVALDPELLGQVFENLLASYNEETKTSARKQTGSFYTPREIVNYMVDSSIKEYLKVKNKKIDELSNKLDKLFYLKNTENPFNTSETKHIIKSINDMKIIDPACGSGAFPMGILNRLVELLGILDKNNEEWKQLRVINAITKDIKEKKELLKEVEEIFEEDNYNSNYARKLYLIENSIYGLDIQPMAIQITKLRFFISLVIEQEMDKEKKNLGIRTLPNLEIKFLPVNTLLDLDIDDNHWASLKVSNYKELNNDLSKIRHKYFSAKTSTTKKNWRKKDKEKREEIKKVLLNYKWDEKEVEKISNWNPYEYNESSPFFNSELMFGEKEKFDIVIGNPPYIRHEKIKDLKPELKKLYKTFVGTGDIYLYFYEKGYNLLKEDGILSYITSKKWTKAKYGKNFRKFLLSNTDLLSYIDFNGVKVFEGATVDTSVVEFKKFKTKEKFIYCDIDKDYTLGMNIENYIKKKGFEYKKEDLDLEGFSFLNPKELNIKKRIKEIGTPLKDWDIKIYRGFLTGFNEAFIINEKIKNELVRRDSKSIEIIKPVLRGRDIKEYRAEYLDLWLIATFPALNLDIDDYPAIKEYLEQFLPKLNQTGEPFIDKNDEKQKTRKKTGNKWFETQDQIAYWNEFNKEKIVWKRIGSILKFAYDDKKNYCLDSTCIATGENIKYIMGYLNSKISKYYLSKEAPRTGTGDLIISVQALEPNPIPQISKEQQKPFETLVDYILFLKAQDLKFHGIKYELMPVYFEQIIDGMVYELYFEEILKEADKDIIQYLGELPEIENLSTDEQKMNIIENIFNKLHDNGHKVKNHLFYMDTIEEIKIIEGK